MQRDFKNGVIQQWNGTLEHQQLLMFTGFGAIFSIFALKFMVDFLPLSWRPTAAEMTFVYALLLSGIPATARTMVPE